jgi:DNA-binding NtrC family response regulator
MRRRPVLIVEPYESFASQLVVIARDAGWEPKTSDSFEIARRRLEEEPPDLLVTNVRLGLFNGIQLCYLVKRGDPHTPVIVYASDKDLALSADAQQACGFFERQPFLPHSLPAFLAAADQTLTDRGCPAGRLPDQDRRNPLVVDRRAAFRGGRRATDLAVLHANRLPPPDQPRAGRPQDIQ